MSSGRSQTTFNSGGGSKSLQNETAAAERGWKWDKDQGCYVAYDHAIQLWCPVADKFGQRF